MVLIRRLLGFTHPHLPVAIWQFYAVLLGGLSLELCMMHHYGVALGWEEKMGWPKTDSAKEMFLWNADEAVRVARRLKDSYMEMTALEFAALAQGAFGDRSRAAERARAGADVAMRRGDTTRARKLTRLADGL